MDVTAPTGEATADNVKLSWAIAAGEITVTVVSKPWFVPIAAVWQHVDPLFASNAPTTA